MPRLFSGLELPEAVVGQLALMRGGVVGARWLEPEDYHITLRFIGDIDARTARDIDDALSDIRRPEVPVCSDIGVVGARWLEPEDYHITLRFIGDIDARTARDIDDALSDIRRPEVPVCF